RHPGSRGVHGGLGYGARGWRLYARQRSLLAHQLALQARDLRAQGVRLASPAGAPGWRQSVPGPRVGRGWIDRLVLEHPVGWVGAPAFAPGHDDLAVARAVRRGLVDPADVVHERL